MGARIIAAAAGWRGGSGTASQRINCSTLYLMPCVSYSFNRCVGSVVVPPEFSSTFGGCSAHTWEGEGRGAFTMSVLFSAFAHASGAGGGGGGGGGGGAIADGLKARSTASLSIVSTCVASRRRVQGTGKHHMVQKYAR